MYFSTNICNDGKIKETASIINNDFWVRSEICLLMCILETENYHLYEIV